MDGSRIYFTSDISRLPRVVDCPNSSNTSTVTRLSTWPEHVLLFVIGPPLNDDVSVSLVSGHVTEDIGVLSGESRLLHRAVGGDSSPAARAVAAHDVRLTATIVQRSAGPGTAARLNVRQHNGAELTTDMASSAAATERPSTPLGATASQAAGNCSQETGYGTERSSSAAPTPALRDAPPASPAPSSLGALVATSTVATGAGAAVIAPPEFDEEDSDDGELPWPSSGALALDLDHLSPVPGSSDVLDRCQHLLPVIAAPSSSIPAGRSQGQDLVDRISPVPAGVSSSASPAAASGSIDNLSSTSHASPGAVTPDLDRTSPAAARSASDSPMDQGAGRLSPTPTGSGARDPERLAPVTPVSTFKEDAAESTPMDDGGLQCTPDTVRDRSESCTPASAASGARPRKRTKGGRWSSSKRRKPAPSVSPNQSSSGEPCMSGRWGHAACLLDDNNVLIMGGEGTYKRMAKDSLLRVTIGESNPDDKVLYMYGGSKAKKWYSDVQALDVTTCKWQKLEMKGVAPSRAYHSCSFFRKEGLVFGGIFPEPDPEPDGSSNDLFIFSLSEQNWYKPVVTGDLPCPRSGHSAARLGHHLYILGGWDYPSFFDDLFVLDLELMDFKRSAVTGTGPCARTWHSMTVLPDRRLLVYGGYSGDVALNDAFILNTENMAWSSVRSDSSLVMLPARVGHSVTASPEAEDGSSQLLVCGGGDNDGKFFSDLIVIKCDDL